MIAVRFRGLASHLVSGRSRLARFLWLVCGAWIIAGTLPISAAETESAGHQTQMLALAKTWFYAFENAHVARTQLDPSVNRGLTADLIRREGARLRSFGVPTSWKYLGSEQISYATGYDFLITFPHARVVESIAVDADGKIGGIDFRMFVEK